MRRGGKGERNHCHRGKNERQADIVKIVPFPLSGTTVTAEKMNVRRLVRFSFTTVESRPLSPRKK